MKTNGTQLNLPIILVITSFPPRECGIATYSSDLKRSLNVNFGSSFSLRICALESGVSGYNYGNEVDYVLDTSNALSYNELTSKINSDNQIKLVLVQHEFGFFNAQEYAFLTLLHAVNKPVIVVFHTVLPRPDKRLKLQVREIARASVAIVVMTNNAMKLLIDDYLVPEAKITVIAHGTHLVHHLDKNDLKTKYGLSGKKVLTTFGLLSSGKSIETTLKALPAIVKNVPDVIFLVIGKTHPEVLKHEGEKYRNSLQQLIVDTGMTPYVRFINKYLSLPDLLEYLQLTDIYLFTTNDPNQAVSGTFVYAMSCGCPIISTPIPHAREVLTNDTGIVFDFKDSKKLAEGVIMLLNNEPMRRDISMNTLQKIISTAWENSAVAHVKLFSSFLGNNLVISYNLPAIKTDHLQKMTTGFGIIQFSKINHPDLQSGYTLDDNARAMIAMCMQYELFRMASVLELIKIYLSFVEYCLQPSGSFLNYVTINKEFTAQNQLVNLDDANGRTMWALGFLISMKSVLPPEIVTTAKRLFHQALPHCENIHSTRALSFIIKGLFYYNKAESDSFEIRNLTESLADRIANMYTHESIGQWNWFESYLTYANSILPESMLCAYVVTDDERYKKIAYDSMNFLISEIFNENGIEVVSNKGRYNRGDRARSYGEQPIDVAYTIIALAKFYDLTSDRKYLRLLIVAFEWFLGKNRLNQTIYNPCTGGCYDGMEEFNVNMNQGAESTVSYLLARYTIQKYKNINN